jgi:hypothetical protein
MRNLARLAIGACLAGLTLGPAAAADLPSIKSLLAAGYEIRSVTFIPVDALGPLGIDPKTPQVIVTLQRGAAIAACEYLAVNWIGLVAGSMEGTTQCDVYPK